MIAWKTFITMPADEREAYSTSDVRMKFELRRGLACEWVRLLGLDPVSTQGRAAFQQAGFDAPMLAAISFGPLYLAEWIEAQEPEALGFAETRSLCQRLRGLVPFEVEG